MSPESHGTEYTADRRMSINSACGDEPRERRCSGPVQITWTIDVEVQVLHFEEFLVGGQGGQ